MTANTRIFAGTPSVSTTPASLTYTVTDTRTDTITGTASLTFTVKTVEVTVNTAAGETVDYLDGAIAALNIGGVANNDMRLFLPSVNSVTAVAVTAYTPSSLPAGVTFSNKTMDITLTPAATPLPTGTTATVCLSTDGVPMPRRITALYRLPTAPATATWEKIGVDTDTHAGFVCGVTDEFSPFAVGYGAPVAIDPTTFPDTLAFGNISLGTGTNNRVNFNLIHRVTTAIGKTYYFLDRSGSEVENQSRRIECP